MLFIMIINVNGLYIGWIMKYLEIDCFAGTIMRDGGDIFERKEAIV